MLMYFGICGMEDLCDQVKTKCINCCRNQLLKDNYLPRQYNHTHILNFGLTEIKELEKDK